MIDLYTLIKTKLDSIVTGVTGVTANVFTEKPSNTVSPPFIVFNFSNSNPLDEAENFILEIDIWDNNQDTTDIEKLNQGIKGDGNKSNPSGLDHYTYNDDDITASFYLLNRMRLPDPDETIRRRQLRFEVLVYFK